MKNWNGKKQLTPEEVYGEENKNLIDESFIFYEDKTCLEMKDNYIAFYKLENPYTIDIPLYKWKKVLHREDDAAIEYYDNSKYYILDGKLNRIKSNNFELFVNDYKIYNPGDVFSLSNDFENKYYIHKPFSIIVKPLENRPSYIEYENGNVYRELYFNENSQLIKEITNKDNIRNVKNYREGFYEESDTDITSNKLTKKIEKDYSNNKFRIEVENDYLNNKKTITYAGKNPEIKTTIDTKTGRVKYFKEKGFTEFIKVSKFRYNLIKKYKYKIKN
jgi:hypothetical protein